MQSLTKGMKVILAEFDKYPTNLDNLKKYFDDVEVFIDLPRIFDGSRAGWRNNDYWKVKKLLDYEGVAISFDGDMTIVSDKVREIEALTKKFGICLPANSRYLVGVDAEIGADGGYAEIGSGYALNCGIISLDNTNERAKTLVRKYVELMEKEPARGPLIWWRAIWETGITPYLLPQQWCVCEKDIGIGNEIILHTGHNKVYEHYFNGSPR